MAAPALAQTTSEQPAVFVHGFRSEGSTWAQAADRLARDYVARASRPTLDWRQRFATQASALRSATSSSSLFPDTTILIGHSNGGLVSREANRQSRPAKGIITVGTLHQGAPIAANINVVGSWGNNVYYFNARPVWHYAWFWDWVSWYASWYSRQMAYVGASMFGATTYIGIDPNQPVLGDMVPGSYFLTNSVNSAANLSREAAQLRQRVGIGSRTYDNLGIMWSGLVPDNWSYFTGLQYSAIWWQVFAFEYYYSYWNWWDPDYWWKWTGSWLWLDAASVNLAIDPVWCVLLGAWSTNGCTANDGIVPLSSQRYPGTGAKNYDIVGPAHQEETRSPRFYDDALRFTMDNDFLTRRRQ
jgi:pimeloyl-ACP methyl ester carboxylesterase